MRHGCATCRGVAEVNRGLSAAFPTSSVSFQQVLTDTRRTLWACGVARAIAQHADICCHTANTDGAPGRIRTSDTRFRKPVLYPLSYEGRVS